jgi:hypothetical protein
MFLQTIIFYSKFPVLKKLSKDKGQKRTKKLKTFAQNHPNWLQYEKIVSKILYSHAFINSSNFAKYTSGLSAFEQDHKIEKKPCIKLMNLGILNFIQFLFGDFFIITNFFLSKLYFSFCE